MCVNWKSWYVYLLQQRTHRRSLEAVIEKCTHSMTPDATHLFSFSLSLHTIPYHAIFPPSGNFSTYHLMWVWKERDTKPLSGCQHLSLVVSHLSPLSTLSLSIHSGTIISTDFYWCLLYEETTRSWETWGGLGIHQVWKTQWRWNIIICSIPLRI